ncbi:hypothetical protein DESPIG_02007 [Desulfovibrio piger ATCC 29098]|uniref:Uncharacterized protein n=1 Tax=Desulfovibrio piger ATCC 29098 TaxID=411464 RepID=B6WV91_9BACT|nr:hypothetical protein DESPIG_02007 [Desulfovibrio piger ATCC 29098]
MEKPCFLLLLAAQGKHAPILGALSSPGRKNASGTIPVMPVMPCPLYILAKLKDAVRHT